MLPRHYENLQKYLEKNKVLVLYGPRRVGKTTLLRKFLQHTKMRYKLDSGDNMETQEILSSQNFSRIQEYIGEYELIAIDEAQQIPNIGMGLKIIVDESPHIYVIATGSSSFDLSNKIGEPLTGRKRTLSLYPLSQKELKNVHNKYELRSMLEDFLIFGAYPEVLEATSKEKKQEILEELVNSYLLKDILALERVKSPKLLLDLLKILAFQVGHEVSVHELGIQLKIDVKTVERYLDLLEKGFILFRRGGFSRNLRKEISKKAKYFFLDTGIRNAVISQFNRLENRNDVGQLFENFIMVERMKKCAYEGIFHTAYFWRTYDEQEIDLIEERDGKLFAFEVKWSAPKKTTPPKEWKQTYLHSEFHIIQRENYLDFIL